MCLEMFASRASPIKLSGLWFCSVLLCWWWGEVIGEIILYPSKVQSLRVQSGLSSSAVAVFILSPQLILYVVFSFFYVFAKGADHSRILLKPLSPSVGLPLPEKCPYLAVCSICTISPPFFFFWHHAESLVALAFLGPCTSFRLSLGPTEGWFLLSCATCCNLLQMQPSRLRSQAPHRSQSQNLSPSRCYLGCQIAVLVLSVLPPLAYPIRIPNVPR